MRQCALLTLEEEGSEQEGGSESRSAEVGAERVLSGAIRNAGGSIARGCTVPTMLRLRYRMEANLSWIRRRTKATRANERGPSGSDGPKWRVRVRDRSERPLGHLGTYRARAESVDELCGPRRGYGPAPKQDS